MRRRSKCAFCQSSGPRFVRLGRTRGFFFYPKPFPPSHNANSLFTSLTKPLIYFIRDSAFPAPCFIQPLASKQATYQSKRFFFIRTQEKLYYLLDPTQKTATIYRGRFFILIVLESRCLHFSSSSKLRISSGFLSNHTIANTSCHPEKAFSPEHSPSIPYSLM